MYFRDTDWKIALRVLLFGCPTIILGAIVFSVIGPAFFLAPFLLGTGINRLAFVGTLASITFVMNVVKLSVFGATELITGELLLLGVLIGLMIANFIYLAAR